MAENRKIGGGKLFGMKKIIWEILALFEIDNHLRNL